MVCKRCGNNIPNGSKFCQRCGNMVAQSRPQQYPIQNKPFPQPQMPSDNGKKKDNVKVKILAIVLAGLILIVGLLATVAGINSKKGIPSDALHVKDFPVLKRTAVLSVYDEEIFPAEEYEIKVEKYNMGGAFKNLGSKEVVLRDETTEPTYELELEDGDYRVTLTDTTERAERETTSTNNSEHTDDVVYKDIVLEVKVDDDKEEAVDDVSIYSVVHRYNMPPKESDFIEASEDNINDFVKMLDETRWYCYEESLLEFNHTRASANDIAEIMYESYGALYEYYFDDLESINGNDPKGKYPDGSFRGSKEKFEWICEEVYNVEFDEDDCDEEFIYFGGDYFYLYQMPGGCGLSTYTLKSYERVGDKYEIIVDMRFDTMVEGYEGPRVTYKATAAIKTNNGDRFWSVYKIEEYDSEQTTTTEPTESNSATPPEFLEATNADFNKLVETLENMDAFGIPIVYSHNSSDAYQKLLTKLLEPISATTFYKYIYNKEAEYVEATEGSFQATPGQLDPMKKYGEYYRYGKVSADEIDWIIRNIFNVTPNRAKATITPDDNFSNAARNIYFYEDYYYFDCGDGGDCASYPVIKTKRADENNVYTVEFDLFYGMKDDSYADTYDGSYKAVCALKEIGGRKYWTFYSIDKIR